MWFNRCPAYPVRAICEGENVASVVGPLPLWYRISSHKLLGELSDQHWLCIGRTIFGNRKRLAYFYAKVAYFPDSLSIRTSYLPSSAMYHKIAHLCPFSFFRPPHFWAHPLCRWCQAEPLLECQVRASSEVRNKGTKNSSRKQILQLTNEVFWTIILIFSGVQFCQ